MEEWTNKEFIDEKFEGANFKRKHLQGCRFIRCSFRRTPMSELLTHGCLFSACDFTNTKLNASSHQSSAFTNCTFAGTNLFSAQFTNCKMTGSSFMEVDMTALSIVAGDWSYTNLRHSNLKGFDLKRVRFTEADLYGCTLRER